MKKVVTAPVLGAAARQHARDWPPNVPRNASDSAIPMVTDAGWQTFVMAATDHAVTLLTRVGCHLCDDAKDVIARISAETGVEWNEVDVDADPELAYEYGDRVPVVLLDGKEHGFWRVEESRLLRDLAR